MITVGSHVCNRYFRSLTGIVVSIDSLGKTAVVNIGHGFVYSLISDLVLA